MAFVIYINNLLVKLSLFIYCKISPVLHKIKFSTVQFIFVHEGTILATRPFAIISSTRYSLGIIATQRQMHTVRLSKPH